MRECIVIDPSADRRWLEFLALRPQSSVFHHPAWIRVLESTYGYRPFCLAVTGGDSLAGILPLMEVRSWLTGRHAVCLPFSDACGPVYDDPEAGAILIGACRDAAGSRHWDYVELRGPSEGEGYLRSASYAVHALRLDPDPEKLFVVFKKTQIQQSIMKARRSGVSVERRTDRKAMSTFVRLNAMTRRRHGLPPQPDLFFDNLRRLMIGNGLGYVSVATAGGREIAASVCLHYGKRMFYKYNASEETALHLHPNHLIVWDAVAWGCEHGFESFDFGRTDTDNPGLLFFKRGWGATETDLHYYRWNAPDRPVRAERARSTGRFAPVLKKLPIPVLKMIGKVLYGHAG